MKKSILAFCALFLFLCQSCDNGSDQPEETIHFTTVGLVSEVNIKNVQNDLPDDLTDVTFVAHFHVPGRAIDEQESFIVEDTDKRIMTSVPFNNEGTKLVFPENPPQELLRNIKRDIPAGFTISDPEANTISFTELAFYSDNYHGKIAGNFSLRRDLESVYYSVEYIYCDRPVRITGNSKDWWDDSTTYNVNLGKGWNMVVRKLDNSTETRAVTYTNSMPDEMEWRYARWIGGR